MSLQFLSEPAPPRATLLPAAPGVSRLVAANPGRMTYHGTNTYLLEGAAGVAVLDPGPDDSGHVRDTLRLAPGPIRHILLTHTHPDHVGAVAALRQATGAQVAAWHTSAEPAFTPDRPLTDAEKVAGLVALFTPGHAADHLCFARDDGVLFSGDLVMGWSTTVVSPPEGDMTAYVTSLRRLLDRPGDRLYLPGHGPAVPDPKHYAAGLLAHRLAREAAILAAIADQPATPGELVTALYPNLADELRPAAERSVLAHLLKLQAETWIREASSRWERLG